MWGVATIVALSAGTLGTAELEAQAASAMNDEARAAALVEKAEELSKVRANFHEAASHYREAVDLYDGRRPAVEPLRMAGRLAFYMGDESRAYRDFARAGEIALEWGDVVSAANAFLDAAWIARERDQGAQAVDMITRAEKLSHSPLIAASDRRGLQERIAEQQP